MKKILIVDDEVAFTGLLKRILEKTGDYEVFVENVGTKAIAVGRATRPDLIFLDVIMPEIEGGEVAAQIEVDPVLKGTPIVFMTAVLSKDEARSGVGSFGGYPYIAKPVTIQEVIATIAKHAR